MSKEVPDDVSVRFAALRIGRCRGGVNLSQL